MLYHKTLHRMYYKPNYVNDYVQKSDIFHEWLLHIWQWIELPQVGLELRETASAHFLHEYQDCRHVFIHMFPYQGSCLFASSSSLESLPIVNYLKYM